MHLLGQLCQPELTNVFEMANSTINRCSGDHPSQQQVKNPGQHPLWKHYFCWLKLQLLLIIHPLFIPFPWLAINNHLLGQSDNPEKIAHSGVSSLLLSFSCGRAQCPVAWMPRNASKNVMVVNIGEPSNSQKKRYNNPEWQVGNYMNTTQLKGKHVPGYSRLAMEWPAQSDLDFVQHINVHIGLLTPQTKYGNLFGRHVMLRFSVVFPIFHGFLLRSDFEFDCK